MQPNWPHSSSLCSTIRREKLGLCSPESDIRGRDESESELCIASELGTGEGDNRLVW